MPRARHNDPAMTMSISDAAAASDLSIDTICYYDRLGIIGAVSCTPPEVPARSLPTRSAGCVSCVGCATPVCRWPLYDGSARRRRRRARSTATVARTASSIGTGAARANFARAHHHRRQDRGLPRRSDGRLEAGPVPMPSGSKCSARGVCQHGACTRMGDSRCTPSSERRNLSARSGV
jgi:hypothetical protein